MQGQNLSLIKDSLLKKIEIMFSIFLGQEIWEVIKAWRKSKAFKDIGTKDRKYR